MWVFSANWKKLKKSLYDEQKGGWDMHRAGDLVMCLYDFNGHVGRHIDELNRLHRGYGIGKSNFEGRM